MAKKIYDEEINEKTDWGGDESTGGAPVSGRRIQEFIKKQLEESKSKSNELESEIQEIQDSLAGSDYTAIINVSTPMYNTVSYGTTGHYIDFTFQINHKSGMPTGEAVICTYTFKRGSSTQTITEQYVGGKGVHFNIDKYLFEGVNTITISIQGVDSKASVTTNVTYQVVNLSISCNYDISKVYDLSEESQELSLEFTVSGTGTKTVEWYLDSELLPSDAEIDEVTSTSATRTKSITLSNLSEGVHSIQARVKTIIDGEAFYSHVEYIEFIVYNNVAETPRVAISMTIPAEIGIITERVLYSMQQYVPYYLRFATYNPKSSTSEVVITLGGEFQGALNSENNVPTGITLLPTKDGESQIEFVIGGISDILDTQIQPSEIAVEEITDSLQLDFSAKGKSNNSIDKDSWFFNDYEGTFEGFYWNNTSGWIDNALLINAGASFEINYAPLNINPSAKGKTIEIEFSSTNVNNDDEVLLDLLDEEGVGLLITATNVKLVSRGGKVIETSYKDNEMVRMAFVINKASGTNNKCLSFIYINGVLSRAIDWLSTDDYISPKTLRFTGTDGAEISLKSLRIYDKALSSDEILNNYTLYRDSASEMIDVYERNNVYIEGSESFDYEKMLSRLPVMIVTGNVPLLEETNNKNDQITIDIDYFNFQDTSRSFRMVNAAMRPQGTSSMGYPKKNFRIYTEELENTILYDANNRVVESKLYSFKENAQPVNCWCLKADYAESSGTHNTGIARLWNEVLVNTKIDDSYPLRTEAQRCALENDYPYDVRTTIDGFPILMFYRLEEDSPLVFIGKYNFNNDKSTESVFGFRDIPGFDDSNMQCWEILNNGNSISLFTDISKFYELITVEGETQEGWKFAFESRYPDTKTPETGDLYTFCKWMTNVPESTFTTEKWYHLDVYKVAAYYVYLMRFGAVDQTVKNAMLTSEDGDHFYFINYDNDTINGLINTGHLVAPWNIDRTTLAADGEPYYAGRDSRLWNLLERDEEFMAIVKNVDNALYSAGLRYDNVIKMFDDDQANKWVERVYNRDSQYKYIGPYNERGVNNLFMLQGSRSEHRKYWLARRFAYYDSLFVSGAYKSQSIELKCLNNTPAGQKFKITAGTDMDYGYGINNIARASNISLHQNEEYEFETPEDINLNLGDPIRIYAAPNIKALDLSTMTDRLAVVTIDGVLDPLLGTKFKKFILGSPIAENTAVSNISGLANAKRLEYLDIRNMKGLTALDLSNQKNIQYVDARGSNITNIEFAVGASLQTLKMPAAMRVLKLEQLPYLSDLTSENNFLTLQTIIVKNCPYITRNFQMIYDWRMGTQLGAEKLKLEMTGVQWVDIAPEELISLGGLGSISLKGKAYLTSVTQEQVDSLTAIFGENCFNEEGDFQIIAPDGLFISGFSEVRGGKTIELNAAIFSEYPGSVTWSIKSGNGASIQSSSGLSCVVATTESTSDRDIVVQARHVPSGAGEVTYATKTIKVTKVIRATGGTITGPDAVGSFGEYKFTATPSDVDEPYSVEWSLTYAGGTNSNFSGDINDYVSIKNQNNESCQIQILQKIEGVKIYVVATVNNGKSSFSVQKQVELGVTLTLNIYSNQSDDEDVIANIRAMVYDEASNSWRYLANGDQTSFPANTLIKIVFTTIDGYKTPDTIEFVIGEEDVVKFGTYLAEQVEVSLSAYDGGNLSGTTVNINGTDYTWNGTSIKAKIAFDTNYTIQFSRVGEYLTPSKMTITASQATRNINAVYDLIPDDLVIIDQTITDPAAMISGAVNSSVIQQIRAGSHRYLGKYTADGQMTLCQLSDADSTKYADGTDAVLTGTEGDVFMKMPDFWYRGFEIETDVWGLLFCYGSASPGAGWAKWDTDALIGVYEAYSEGEKLYSHSGVISSGNISQANFKAYARNRGDGFRIVDWQMHCVMAILFYAQYGHTNCEEKIGTGTSSSSKQCGQTDVNGMNDTKGTSPVSGLNDAGADGNAQSINFWGLENWWGNKHEWIDNVVVHWESNSYNNWEITEPDGTVRNVDKHKSGLGFITKMLFSEQCDLIPTKWSGSSTTGYCDEGNVANDNSRVVRRSGSGQYGGGGVACVNVAEDSSFTDGSRGSRLTFRGQCTIEEDSEIFKSLVAIG